MEAPFQGWLTALKWTHELNDSFAKQKGVQEVNNSFEAQRIANDLNGAKCSNRARQIRRDPRKDQSYTSTTVFNDDLDEEEETDDVPLQPNYSPECNFSVMETVRRRKKRIKLKKLDLMFRHDPMHQQITVIIVTLAIKFTIPLWDRWLTLLHETKFQNYLSTQKMNRRKR
jgi:hypothetical protein